MPHGQQMVSQRGACDRKSCNSLQQWSNWIWNIPYKRRGGESKGNLEKDDLKG